MEEKTEEIKKKEIVKNNVPPEKEESKVVSNSAEDVKKEVVEDSAPQEKEEPKVVSDFEKGIKKGNIVVLVIPNDKYSEKIGEIAKYLSSNYNGICYVSLNKLFESLEKSLNDAGANTKKFLFIDGISKSVNPSIKEKGNVIYVQSASALTEISLSVAKVFKTGKFDGFLFDSLSTLLVYNKSNVVGKFVHDVINKIKSQNITAIFTALEGDTKSDLLKECSMYVDNVITLK